MQHFFVNRRATLQDHKEEFLVVCILVFSREQTIEKLKYSASLFFPCVFLSCHVDPLLPSPLSASPSPSLFISGRGIDPGTGAETAPRAVLETAPGAVLETAPGNGPGTAGTVKIAASGAGEFFLSV